MVGNEPAGRFCADLKIVRHPSPPHVTRHPKRRHGDRRRPNRRLPTRPTHRRTMTSTSIWPTFLARLRQCRHRSAGSRDLHPAARLYVLMGVRVGCAVSAVLCQNWGCRPLSSPGARPCQSGTETETFTSDPPPLFLTVSRALLGSSSAPRAPYDVLHDDAPLRNVRAYWMQIHDWCCNLAVIPVSRAFLGPSSAPPAPYDILHDNARAYIDANWCLQSDAIPDSRMS